MQAFSFQLCDFQKFDLINTRKGNLKKNTKPELFYAGFTATGKSRSHSFNSEPSHIRAFTPKNVCEKMNSLCKLCRKTDIKGLFGRCVIYF